MGYDWLEDALWNVWLLGGLEPFEVMEALTTGSRWPRGGRVDDLGLPVVITWCRTSTGRALLVVTRKLDQWNWQIIGVRDLSSDEVMQFEAWEANRND